MWHPRLAAGARAAARVFAVAGWLAVIAAPLAAWRYTSLFERLDPVPNVGNTDEVIGRLRPCAPDEPFAFAVLGDINNLDSRGMTNFKAALRRAQEPGVRFLLLGGDLCGHTTRRAYGFGLAQLRAVAPAIPTFIAPGNHDLGVTGEGKEFFLRAFGRDYASFLYGNSLFLLLNNGTYMLDAGQFAWLERTLAGRPPGVRHVFAIAHRPIVDYLEMPTRYHLDPDEFPVLVNLFERGGVDFLFTGHSHGNRRYRAGRTTYLVLGGRSKDRPDDAYLPLVVVRVSGERVEEEFVPIAPQREDGSMLEEYLGVDPAGWAREHARGLGVFAVLLLAATWWSLRRPMRSTPG
ncbi:MAG: metallophosphoesterase [Planctomycetes bacterium]|nr:metallophosphoesterase [Planctomycetota bacterium]